MENKGIIEKVTQAMEWCAVMVLVLKPNRREIHICADLRQLNKAVRREKYVMPTVEEILPRLTGSKVFTLLDAASGFRFRCIWKAGCSLLLSPRLGGTSAPEIFQRKMAETLAGLDGVEIFMDDVLIHGGAT